MSDLIRRSDAKDKFKGHGATLNAIVRFGIEMIPAVDAVEVIRCKDCAYYTASPFGHRIIGWCKIDGKHRGQNFYCANGDRKDTEV